MEAEDQPTKPTFSPTTSQPEVASEAASSGGAGILIPMVVALIGVVFGAIGIFFGLSSQKKIGALEENLAGLSAEQAALPGQISSATAGMGDLESKLSNISSSVEALKSRSRMDRDSLARKLGSYESAIEANRSQINSNTEAISEIPKTAITVPASGAARSETDAGSPSDEASPESSVVSVEGGVHIIESGDTFGRLSSRYGVSVQAIMNANPGLDPRRLRIGQPVTIPPSE